MKAKNILLISLCAAFLLVAIFAILVFLNKSKAEKTEKNETEEIDKIEEGENEMADTKSLDETNAKKTVGILVPPEKPAYYDDLLQAIGEGSGAQIMEIAWEELEDALKPNVCELFIWPEAKDAPFGAKGAVDSYLKNGGKLLTLGGPPLSNTLYPSEGGWQTRDQLIAGAAKGDDRDVLFDFESAPQTKNWSRATNSPESGHLYETGDFGSPDGGYAMHVAMDNMTGWDSIYKNNIKVAAGHNSLALYAKGGPVTTSLCIELQEKDGSRWFATFKLGQSWQYFVLGVGDFVYWHDSSAAGRGGPGDQINFDNVSFFGIGLALSHVSVSQGAHEFWFDGVCLLDFEQLSEPALVLDGLSPEWKFYPITNGAKATAFQNQIFVSERDYALPGELFSPSPRPQGTGYGRERELRFVPLIEVFDEKGLRSGYLAWMYINQTARSAGRDYNSSIIASFGSSDPTFYSGSGGEAVLEVVKALLGDAFFVEAGSDEYIYVESETKSIPIGAYVRAKSGEGLTVELELYKSGEIIHKDSLDLSSLKATNKKNDVGLYNISQKYDMASGGPDKIAFTLKKDGLPIDFISHEIVMWSPKPEAERQYITASGNEFMRGGEALRLYGVNYMPSSGIGVNAENGAYFEYYVSSQSYDPDVIQNDLQRVKEIGFNSVSVFVYHHTAQETKNMLHLIDMCDKLGLYVDLSIRPYADPFNLDEAQVADMISLLHIAQLDNIVAYDIAWERYFGTYEGSYGNPSGRKAYDGLWRDWIERNYGSLENAEAIWGYKAPKSGAEAVGPTDEMLRTGGAYDTMVAAYRRFVDGLVSEKHNYVKDLIMEHDPNHLVSTRTGSQGGVPLADPGDMGYDYEALSNGLDFMSPESYAINGRLETSDQGVFTNVYSRYAKPGAPVMWKEFGQHVWNGSNFADKTEELRLQAEYYDAIYEMMLSGHTGAAYCWFWPGGYRVNEGSDYGIINPDGSDRPVTQVIRDHAQRFYAQPPLGEPDIFFEVDRDLSSSGIKAMYEAMQDDFVDAVKSGKTIAFADAATGKDTASVSDAAIGGGTAGAKNPARWVDGEFRAVYIKLSDGSWKRIRRGETVKLDSGPVEIKLVMGNTKNSAWLSANENDSAYISLVSSENSDVAFEIPLAERVEHLGTLTQEFVLCENFDKQAAIAFRFGIKDRFVFGDIFEFNVAEK